MGHALAVFRGCFLIAFAATATFAQTTFATITGTVTDQNEAVIPGVIVEATHLQSNYHYTAPSNQAGVFTLAQLREGAYTLRALSWRRRCERKLRCAGVLILPLRPSAVST